MNQFNRLKLCHCKYSYRNVNITKVYFLAWGTLLILGLSKASCLSGEPWTPILPSQCHPPKLLLWSTLVPVEACCFSSPSLCGIRECACRDSDLGVFVSSKCGHSWSQKCRIVAAAQPIGTASLLNW